MQLPTPQFSFEGRLGSFEFSGLNPCSFKQDCQLITEVALFQLAAEDYFVLVGTGQRGMRIALDLELGAD